MLWVRIRDKPIPAHVKVGITSASSIHGLVLVWDRQVWLRCVLVYSCPSLDEADEHRCDRQSIESPFSRGSCSMASKEVDSQVRGRCSLRAHVCQHVADPLVRILLSIMNDLQARG